MGPAEGLTLPSPGRSAVLLTFPEPLDIRMTPGSHYHQPLGGVLPDQDTLVPGIIPQEFKVHLGEELVCPPCPVLPGPGLKVGFTLWAGGFDRLHLAHGPVARVWFSVADNILLPEFEGMEIHSEMVFNNPDVVQSNLAAENEDGDLKGPVVDRKCLRCGHEGMVYHTRQTRSADEGQTVFYTCTSCRYQEKEDS
ncbi:DNA-directed RNA polymerase I subunit RPA12 [Chiloscyllium punctatum]|uniref:DNA-directed RNA polymerase I subunit RPA12 n=1 Tax=Chiloscyllium punctatum TaxID=137246 RepID=UPI003B638BFA